MPYHIDLPQINGLSEKEQISQLNNYLYRQAEQLQFALNSIENGNNGSYSVPQGTQSISSIFGSIKGLIQNSNDIIQAYYKKFATHGNAEGWTYIKWLGGTYEMYGTFEVTPTSFEKGETLYITEAIQIKTPFKIAEDAVVTGTGDDRYWISSGKYADEDNISIKLISDKELTEALTVRLRVVGTYAIDEEYISLALYGYNNTEEENGDSQSN